MKFGFLDFSSCNLVFFDSVMIINEKENEDIESCASKLYFFTIKYDTMPLKINNFEQNEFLLHDNNEKFDHWKCWGIEIMLLEIVFVMFLINWENFMTCFLVIF